MICNQGLLENPQFELDHYQDEEIMKYQNYLSVFLFTLILLPGCSWLKTQFSNTQSQTSLSTKESFKKQAAKKSMIEGAYGWKLGEIAPQELECEEDRRSRCVSHDSTDFDSEAPLRLERLIWCEVKSRDPAPEGWKIRICIAPKSRTIYQIVVDANIDDSAGQIALKQKLIEKYGNGRTALMDTVFEHGENTLRLREPGGLETLLFYTNIPATILAAKEHAEIRAEEIRKAEEKTDASKL